MELLEAHPQADYIVFGQKDAPLTPHAIAFNGHTDCTIFLCYRRRLLVRGPVADLDALVYMLMTLVPALRRKGIDLAAVENQLGEEYGHEHVKRARSCIHGQLYHHLNGKKLAIGEIYASQDDLADLLGPMRDSGRFPELLKHLKT